jgi:hydrogenase nickel incorporation protein HypA/HybF
MHETHLASDILKLVLEKAQNKRVKKITIMIGELEHVTQASFAAAFELVARGTAAEGAEIVAEIDEAKISYPACDSPLIKITSGEGVWVKEIEVQ